MEIHHIGPENAETFNELVKNKHSIIKAYSPTCMHCIMMSEEWDKLQEKMERNKKIDQSKKPLLISLRNDALSLIDHPITGHIHGFPTIIELKEDGATGQQYMGPRTMNEMGKWVMDKLKKHTTIQYGGKYANKKHITSKKKTSKKKKSSKHANKKHITSKKKTSKKKSSKHANKKHITSKKKTSKKKSSKHANKKHTKSYKK